MSIIVGLNCPISDLIGMEMLNLSLEVRNLSLETLSQVAEFVDAASQGAVLLDDSAEENDAEGDRDGCAEDEHNVDSNNYVVRFGGGDGS